MTAVKQAKHNCLDFMEKTPGLKDYKSDPNFEKVYMRTFSYNMGAPSMKWLEGALERNPDNHYTPFIKNAIKYTKDLKEADRLQFNRLFKWSVEKAKEWQKAGKAMDAGLVKLDAKIESDGLTQEVKDVSKHFVEAIDHRDKM